jgi:hypothetical protein
MPKNYKTYSSPGSFGQFQVKVPDQTGKIQRQTEKTIRGMDRARQFEKENQEIFMRAQRLVNSFDESVRQTNFKMQSLERQSFKDALDRDYKIQMDNLDQQNKARQTDLENIAQFSQTAAGLVGQYLKDQEEKKVAAAHDVISRTGVTFKEMVAFQKMDDNLTRSEFGAHDAVQQMFGPDADSKLIDGMFAVYQNRNTKRWVEHQQLYQNSLGKFPAFMEEKIRAKQLEDNERITDFDAFLANVKREFMEINFIGNARPEVLNGAGVYAKLNELVNNRRNVFLQERRKLQGEELSTDRQNAFAVEYNKSGIAGLVRWNSTNPSFEKREDLLEFLKKKVKITGPYALGIEDLDRLLDYENGGSNGKTLGESFPSFATEVELLKDEILERDTQYERQKEAQRERDFDDEVLRQADRLGLDRDGLTAKDVKLIENDMYSRPEYFGISTDIFADLMRLSTDGQRARQTETVNEQLFQLGQLTPEYVRGGHYLNSADFDKWLRLAESDRQQFSENNLKEVHLKIQAAFEGDPKIRANKNAFGKYNDVTYQLQLAEFKRNYKKYYRQIQLSKPDMANNDVSERALSLVGKDIQEVVSNIGADGAIKKYKISSTDEFADLDTLTKAGIQKLGDIQKVLRDKTLSAEIRYERVAEMLDATELERALTNFGSKQWSMPPAIEYIAEETNKNPLQVLEKIAPYIPGNLRLQVDALRDEQKQRYTDFEVTPYSSIRNTLRTPQRTGRANVGDTKTGASAPIRPSMLKVVQYVSGDPAIKETADGKRIVYDNGDGPRGHGGRNYHNHYEFATQEMAATAKTLFEQAGFRVTSYIREHDTDSAHSRGVALDVAPDPNLPYTDEAEARWSAAANAVIGFDPLANE